ncbi:T. brucei spp.-specific protein [Trypanosoma brucei gambiense DAL972]|uniref:T. brucei spp.-specific protein n=1 Tax=Trypanosoma brucei gambiense (strain MHOM/CI/86/DAL972) TaxID=679716 RepID=D0A5L1_TRYB9|nr:T. brucei spp.-specific protein [Trypanosoma brucei gambiense DAL972]CBH16962.1 T. brucei spp.-specific protein [Trypanosoma brucei gambiense DAL972]|eukprot:XP_011779226.1 T. brucei spp.-specific protein [Trypanosoma brucei gambiense DAL972]
MKMAPVGKSSNRYWRYAEANNKMISFIYTGVASCLTTRSTRGCSSSNLINSRKCDSTYLCGQGQCACMLAVCHTWSSRYARLYVFRQRSTLYMYVSRKGASIYIYIYIYIYAYIYHLFTFKED